jgi:transposase
MFIVAFSKDFLEAGKKLLDGDTVRETSSDQVKTLREENIHLKQAVADLSLQNRVLKKSLTGSGNPTDDL